LLQHSLGIEERSVEGDRVPHQLDELISMPVKHWQDHLGQPVIKGRSIVAAITGGWSKLVSLQNRA
jgi:hypothetical protein